MSDTMDAARRVLAEYDGPKIRIMEVCGTHTHEIFRLGVRRLLPEAVDLISGPGCPVCVTPTGYIDEAVLLALGHGATITTFGDLVRVPGTEKSLAQARSEGAKVKVVYAPMDAVDYAEAHPDEPVVFLSVGFETTTPSSCLAVESARARGIRNFYLLTANKTMPNAYQVLKESVDAYLYPGHVHAIIGTKLCEELAEEGVSGVVAGFTARELITAFAVILKKSEEGKPFFVNCYPRVVTREGSVEAQELVARMMEPCDAEWRGIGVIPGSGQQLRGEYAEHDARKAFALPPIVGRSNPGCRCGEVLRGSCRPSDCPLFGKVCTPRSPVGACMVSGEGACSAYYQYGGLE